MAEEAADEAPRRVALVSDWAPPRRGGIEVHILSLARHLRAAGAEATIVTSFPGAPAIDGIDIDRVSTLLLPGAFLAVSPRLVGIAARHIVGRYDLVHVHASQVSPFGLAAAVAAMRAGMPVVVTFHSFMGVLPRLMALAERMGGWSRDRIAFSAVSSVVARQITDVMPSLPVTVLPNGYDGALWQDITRPQPGGPLRMVCAMRLQARKRPGALLDIFARARELAGEGAGMMLTIAGDGPEMRRLRQRVRNMGLEGSVELAGWLGADRLHSLYGASDLFLMPSTKEAFCIAALEARASGLPVLAMGATGVANFITDGVNGELAASDEDMARRLAALATDRARLARLAGEDGGIARHEWAALAHRHLDFYAAVAKSRT